MKRNNMIKDRICNLIISLIILQTWATPINQSSKNYQPSLDYDNLRAKDDVITWQIRSKKQNCKLDKDCNGPNQRCVYLPPIWKPKMYGWCGSHYCHSKADCKNITLDPIIGNQIGAENCKHKLCIYHKFVTTP